MPLTYDTYTTPPKKRNADLLPDSPGRYANMPWSTSDAYRDIDQGLLNYQDAAYGGAREEERRGGPQEDYLRTEKAKADKPTISQQEIDRRFGRQSDSASGNYADAMSGLRDYVGDSGVSGGQVNGLAVNAELARLRQLTTARGDLMSFKATQDALDRQRSFDRAVTVSQSINRPISMLGIDYENQALQTQMARAGLDVNRQGANAQADAARDAGDKSFLGSVIGAGAGLLGGLL
jgi:hypothetical protein